MRKPLESSIEKRLKDELDAAGCIVLKIGYDGYPDRLVLTGKGRHYWVELKRPGGKLRVVQERRIEKLRAMGERVEIYGDTE